MNAADRVALHHRMIEGFLDNFRRCADRREVRYPAELVLADDMILTCPSVGDGEEFPLAKHIAATGLTFSQLASMEWGLYWQHMPDFGAVGSHRGVVDEDGFALWWQIGGTLADGTKLVMHEVDFIQTDENGHVFRWEAFFDWKELGPIFGPCLGHPDGLTWTDYLSAVLAFAPHSAGTVSDATVKAWADAGLLAHA